MKSLLILSTALALNFASLAYGDAGGTAEMKDGRLRIQFRFKPDQSTTPAHKLRPILEKQGFKNEDGYVKTKTALAPLELENYLYEDGKYVFTIYLPTNDPFYVSYDTHGFVSFNGVVAQKLFEVVKLHVPKSEPAPNLEQYQWADGGYCDKSLNTGTYRCWIDTH